MSSNRNSVSQEKLDKILDVFSEIQNKNRDDPVTKKEVTKMLEKFSELNVYDNLIKRAFNILCNQKKIERESRGQYWLSGYNEKSRKYLQRKIKRLETDYNVRLRDFKKTTMFFKNQMKIIVQEKIDILRERDFFKGGYESAKHFLESLRYCDSDEDWGLLETYFKKMLENKYEKERIEGLEAEQEYLTEGLEQLEKKEKRES